MLSKKLRENWTIIAILMLFFIVKFLPLFRFHDVYWDEAVYLAMAKYIYSFGNAGFWEIIRPIGLPFMIGLFWKLGLDIVKSGQFMGIIFSVGCIFLTYIISKKIFTRNIASLAAFILSITPVFFHYSNYILTEIPAAFFGLLAVYFFIDSKYAASAAFAAFAMYMKLTQGILLIIFLLVIIVHNLIKKQGVQKTVQHTVHFIKFYFLAMIPYLVFNLYIYAKTTPQLYFALIRPWILGVWHQQNPAEFYVASTPLLTKLGNVFYYLYFPVFGNSNYAANPLLIFLIFGVIAIILSSRWKDKNVLAITLAFTLTFLYFTYIPNKQMRFFSIFAPYVAMLSAYGFYWIYSSIRFSKKRYLVLIIIILFSFSTLQYDLKIYRWSPATEPQIVTEYYKFFSTGSFNGQILTTDPLLAVYSDAKFIPIYSIDIALKMFNQHRSDIFASVFASDSFYCSDNDKSCISQIQQFSEGLSKDGQLVFNRTYSTYSKERTFYIYEYSQE